jgi:hydrogenase maturation protein HypF
MDVTVSDVERRVITVRGVVQGVGFRPFVHRLATALHLAGAVWNDPDGVTIDAEGSPADLDELERRLGAELPPLASIDEMQRVVCPLRGTTGFSIADSGFVATGLPASLPPDIAVCDDCLRELFDPGDRRFRYPFITCTNCGPRFTISIGLPYDRPNTTMASFELCPTCRAEYDDPADRRFHAQPLACAACGPTLALVDVDGAAREHGDAALVATQRLLESGAIVAVKGLGGYHLMCDALQPGAVAELRRRKGRGDKPFAVMVRDLTVLDGHVDPSAAEVAALRSPQRPIVLLRRRRGAEEGWPDAVAPGAADLGVMLPYTPVHHLLFDALGTEALVCTSGNVTDEPIVTDDDDARRRLGRLADAWLLHDRPIHTACDDSVVRLRGADLLPVRRARGWAPLPVHLGEVHLDPVLAMGGDLKGAVCLAAGHLAWMSQHLGDLADLATYVAAQRAVEQLVDLTGLAPQMVVVDAHPGYLSARLGRELAARWEVPVVAVQHHHAHVASVMAEHRRVVAGTGRVIGMAFDGTGYGPDGSIWGGEVLVVDEHGAPRIAHLSPVPLPGGDAAIEHPARTALAHLWAAGIDGDETLPSVRALTLEERAVVRRQLERPGLSTPTTSMGRLFDAVASLTGLRHTVAYEAQAAIELEAVADRDAPGAYRFGHPSAAGSVPVAPVVAAVVHDVRAGEPPSVVSMRFHRAVARLVLDCARRQRSVDGTSTVALTGGVFQNRLLDDLCTELLAADGFEVLHHHHVPPNDGGLALGQAVVAGSRRMGQG